MEKSKNILEKFKKDSIGRNIGLLMQKTGKSYYELERDGGLSNGALRKWMDKNLDFSTLHLETFLVKHGLDRDKWRAGEIAFVKENPTPSKKETDTTENRDEIYRKMVEENSEYKLVPATLLDGEYRIMLDREIKANERKWTEMMDTKNRLIDFLESRIEELRSGQAPKKAKEKS